MKVNFYGWDLPKIVKSHNVTNQHDLDLIEKFSQLHYTDWGEINEDAAETEEGKQVLHRICSILYHYEEYKAGML